MGNSLPAGRVGEREIFLRVRAGGESRGQIGRPAAETVPLSHEKHTLKKQSAPHGRISFTPVGVHSAAGKRGKLNSALAWPYAFHGPAPPHIGRDPETPPCSPNSTSFHWLASPPWPNISLHGILSHAASGQRTPLAPSSAIFLS